MTGTCFDDIRVFIFLFLQNEFNANIARICIIRRVVGKRVKRAGNDFQNFSSADRNSVFNCLARRITTHKYARSAAE